MTYLKKLLDYEEFSTLIVSAVSNHDTLFRIKGNKLLIKVYFYQHNLTFDSEESEDFNINILTSIILANITKGNTSNNVSYLCLQKNRNN